ncbi:hypothetical protein [Paludibacterium purpuratum]|uniref:Uncharacterized protein n=1 Tax=Paludibacterium purpuratum TaxID=1144873 RepID=A0A4R7BBX7_9NEIS|nr:hypothetical protein [Paludibacterium purpuratum]TDR82163.1 hypothetical protein DFP86_102277 [Paludibacterium purpuratum]
MRQTFVKVTLTATRTWKDPATGKRRSQTKTFFQTLNPFNRNADGQPKTRDEIYVELRAESEAWKTGRAAPMEQGK